MGFFSDVTGGIFGGETSSERGARKAAEELAAGGREAIETTRAAAAPFVALGTETAPQLQESFLAGDTTLQQSSQNVLQDPFFGALAADQEQRLLGSAAARGRAGAGGTQDRLQQNTLLLGNQFRNQDFQSRLQANQQRFSQLFGTTQLGANAAIGSAGQVAGFQTDIASGNAANRIAQGNSTMAGVNNLVGLGTAFATGGASLPFSLGGGGGGGVGSFGGAGSNFGAGGSGLAQGFGDFSDIGF